MGENPEKGSEYVGIYFYVLHFYRLSRSLKVSKMPVSGDLYERGYSKMIRTKNSSKVLQKKHDFEIAS